MNEFEWEIEIPLIAHGTMMFVIQLYRFLFCPKNYRELVTHKLVFKSEKIYYKKDNVMMWILDSSRVSNYELHNGFNISPNQDNGYSVFLNTKGNDKYYFECSLSECEFKSFIGVVIEDWCNV